MSCAYKVHGRTDRRTDGQGDSYIPPNFVWGGGGRYDNIQYFYHNFNTSLVIVFRLLLLFWGRGGCFNVTFSNILAISWRPVLVVEEAGVPGENHRPWASNWSTLSLAAANRVHPFCNLQSQARTHAVLVIGLYELLGNPTT